MDAPLQRQPASRPPSRGCPYHTADKGGEKEHQHWCASYTGGGLYQNPALAIFPTTAPVGLLVLESSGARLAIHSRFAGGNVGPSDTDGTVARRLQRPAALGG